ncbi:MAG: hypothetical protein OQL09_00105 [Gammaproteobacteria bacterium]|nr:hypothetical protein [Gammaproteobacteria bacterium]
MRDMVHHKLLLNLYRQNFSRLWLLLLLGPLSLQANPVDEAIVAMEELQMTWLAKEQTRPGTSIKPFSTDGCSGGLSDAWSYMAQAIPAFRLHFGELPPWQDCCVAHDKSYWQGETEQGYRHRLEADKALQICVAQTGRQSSAALSKQFELTEDEVKQLFTISAAMMYRAVRMGGKPCSYLPWRWGYGWPQCSPYIELGHE